MLAALCVVAALAAWTLNRWFGSRPRPVSGAAVAASPRPTPVPAAWNDAQLGRLRRALGDAFAPALAGADRWSLVAIGADGRTIYDDDADRAAVPASVQKLIVAASALDLLGAGYRFHTIFAAPQAIGADGTLDGNLWLVGSGDPSLRSNDVHGGVETLARAGLHRIDGGVAVDATAMRGPELNVHWDPDDETQDYAAPTSAVSLDGDTLETHQTVDGVDQPAWTPLKDMPVYVGATLDRMLRAAGIGVQAPPAVSPAPLDSIVLWDHRSLPLRPLEAHMLFLSDNHYAEQLLRTLGGETSGTADDASGIDAEQRFLSERGIPVPGLQLFDGSGLAADNRVAAITLARVLSDAELRGGDASLYMLLPQGGRQGTLKYYDFTTALGRVRAKSGHIGGVAALAGYVNTYRHGRVAFAFLINGSPGNPDAAIVRAVDRLVTF